MAQKTIESKLFSGGGTEKSSGSLVIIPRCGFEVNWLMLRRRRRCVQTHVGKSRNKKGQRVCSGNVSRVETGGCPGNASKSPCSLILNISRCVHNDPQTPALERLHPPHIRIHQVAPSETGIVEDRLLKTLDPYSPIRSPHSGTTPNLKFVPQASSLTTIRNVKVGGLGVGTRIKFLVIRLFDLGITISSTLVTDGLENMKCGALQTVKRMVGTACTIAEERYKDCILPRPDVEHTFSSEQSGEITLEVEKYFAVFYDITWYLGRITSLNEDTCTVKFLKENLEKFNWPSHDDIQEVDKEYIFYGPVVREDRRGRLIFPPDLPKERGCKTQIFASLTMVVSLLGQTVYIEPQLPRDRAPTEEFRYGSHVWTPIEEF
uniref:Uncharacterized protein n=1 Tax=Timema poppense TaxID=170557 RepID=A0A7R9D1C4_TIMPO|nr:unnamed protein product [Timema poppensis]